MAAALLLARVGCCVAVGFPLPRPAAAQSWSGGRGFSVLPFPRLQHAMAYDSQRARTVLFAGADFSANMGDTWEWDGSNWTQQSPPSSPVSRSQHAMAYDSQRSRVVLFGGVLNNG